MKQLTFFLSCLLFFSILNSQVVGISGRVVDAETGEGVPGASVTAPETGTATDSEGNFQLDVQEGTMLQFSHIGYKSVSAAAAHEMRIELTEIVIEAEEIIVRAGLTEGSLQRTASSVTVFTKEDISDHGGVHFQSLTDHIPNLNWAGGTSRPRYFQIRGVGERSHYFGEGPPNFSVGFVLDDIDLSGLGMAGLLFDIEQVEVFKGPQSSVYGPNAMAGLILLRSTEPHEKFESNVTTSFGTDNHYKLGAAVNAQLLPGMNLRISGLKNYTDGFRENVSQGITTTNKRDESLLRAKFGFQPMERLFLTGTVLFAELDNGYDAWAPDNNKELKTYSNDNGEDNQRTSAYSLRANYSFSEEMILTSITSFSETDLVHAYDGDWADSSYWHDNHSFDPAVEGWAYEFFDKNEKNRTSLTHELRVSIGSLIVGGFFKQLKEQDEAAGYLFGGVATDANSVYDFVAIAGYAQYTHDLSPILKIKANVRYETNVMEYDGTTQGLNENWEMIDLPAVEFDVDHSMLGYRGSLHYVLDEFTNIYTSVSQGYKSGGVNQQPYLADVSRSFDPEFIQNVEIGIKRATDSHRSQLTVFSNNRTDQQVSVSSQQVEGDPNSFLFFTGNAGSGSAKGWEWEFEYDLTPTIQGQLSVGKLETWVDEFTYQLDTETEGKGGDRAAAMSPKITGSIGLKYRDDSGISASAYLTYKDEYYFSDSHDQISEPYGLLNVSLGKSFGKTTITIWGRNVLDERYAIRGFYFGLIPPDYEDQLWLSYGDPRQIGLTVDYGF
ncbi:MAG: TonB-dependent receptor [Candidatus Marinimicrobia bacterium]|nr:TonB-dependent receptor [Candidatus Neomarinimicrobiota bacterium]